MDKYIKEMNETVTRMINEEIERRLSGLLAAVHGMDWTAAYERALKENALLREEVEVLKSKLDFQTRSVSCMIDDLCAATLRSGYQWSTGGDYTALDYANEGAITCAGALLQKLRDRQ